MNYLKPIVARIRVILECKKIYITYVREFSIFLYFLLEAQFLLLIKYVYNTFNALYKIALAINCKMK